MAASATVRPFLMGYVQGTDRGQVTLLPAAIEDYVSRNAPVRVIDAFVDGLDVVGLGFSRAIPALAGRPPYDPRDLLKLYVWATLMRFARRAASNGNAAAMSRRCGFCASSLPTSRRSLTSVATMGRRLPERAGPS